jgi:hemerythrin
MFMELTKDYLTGHEEVDMQHLQLCEIINNLHEDIEKGVSIETLMSSLTFLSNYTHQHFAYEQQLMFEIGFPETTDHIKNHADLMQELANMGNKFVDSVNINAEDTFAIEFLEFLKRWLLDHIMIEDFKYKTYLQNQDMV